MRVNFPVETTFRDETKHKSMSAVLRKWVSNFEIDPQISLSSKPEKKSKNQSTIFEFALEKNHKKLNSRWIKVCFIVGYVAIRLNFFQFFC